MHSKNQKENKNIKEKTQKKRTKIHRIIALICLLLTGGLYGCGSSEKVQQTELVEVQEERRSEEKSTDEGTGSSTKSSDKDTVNQNTTDQNTGTDQESRKKDKDSGMEDNQNTKASEQEKICYVHVCGAVKNPGVYEVRSESRLYEAIALAGGLTENAAGEGLNQAEKVEDGSRIYVPDKEEYAAGMQNAPESAGTAAETFDNKNGTDKTSVEDGKVNLNTATKEQLMTLSGIGEAKASAIISYRESHGAFQNIEELMQVEGIKDGVFRKVKDQIKV